MRFVIALLAAGVAGCGGGFRSTPVMAGPYELTTAFGDVMRAVELAGYRVSASDPDRGTFDVPANFTQRRRTATITASIRFQLYQQGYFEVRPLGELVETEADGWIVPHGLYDEVAALAAVVATQLGRPAHWSGEWPGGPPASVICRLPYTERQGAGASTWPTMPVARRTSMISVRGVCRL